MKYRNSGAYVNENDMDNSYLGDINQKSIDEAMTNFFPSPYNIIFNVRPLVVFILPSDQGDVTLCTLFSFEDERENMFVAYLCQSGRDNKYNADQYLIAQTTRMEEREMRVGNISIGELFQNAVNIDEVYSTTSIPPKNYTNQKNNPRNKIPKAYINKYVKDPETGKTKKYGIYISYKGKNYFNAIEDYVLTDEDYISTYKNRQK